MKRTFLCSAAVFAVASFWAVLSHQMWAANAVDPSKAPCMVILIRHGEKPPKEQHSPHLTPTGLERAKRIPLLFSPDRTPALPRPDFLFATHFTPSSNREVETLEPLARALHMNLNDQYLEDDIEKLAGEILSGKYAGKVVLVCWHHGKLPALAAALGVPKPPAWDVSIFDRIWKVEWPNGTARMSDLPENLLPGDSR
jgi:hypothetical protein